MEEDQPMGMDKEQDQPVIMDKTAPLQELSGTYEGGLLVSRVGDPERMRIPVLFTEGACA